MNSNLLAPIGARPSFSSSVAAHSRARPSPTAEQIDRSLALLKEEQGIAGWEDLHALDPNMQAVVQQAKLLARSLQGIVISGQVGSGRQLLATVMHSEASPFPERIAVFDPLLVDAVQLQNGAIVNDGLGAALGDDDATALRVQLTSHANADRAASAPRRLEAKLVGAIAESAGGTLVVRNLQAIPLSVQASMIDLLGSGGTRMMRHDDERAHEPEEGEGASAGRVILICDGSLDEQAQRGRVHPKIAAKMRSLELKMPPLSETPARLAMLAELLPRAIAARESKQLSGISDEAAALLNAHHWKGNIDDLTAVLSFAISVHEGGELGARNLKTLGIGARPALQPMPSVATLPALSPVPAPAVQAAEPRSAPVAEASSAPAAPKFVAPAQVPVQKLSATVTELAMAYDPASPQKAASIFARHGPEVVKAELAALSIIKNEGLTFVAARETGLPVPEFNDAVALFGARFGLKDLSSTLPALTMLSTDKAVMARLGKAEVSFGKWMKTLSGVTDSGAAKPPPAADAKTPPRHFRQQPSPTGKVRREVEPPTGAIVAPAPVPAKANGAAHVEEATPERPPAPPRLPPAPKVTELSPVIDSLIAEASELLMKVMRQQPVDPKRLQEPRVLSLDEAVAFTRVAYRQGELPLAARDLDVSPTMLSTLLEIVAKKRGVQGPIEQHLALHAKNGFDARLELMNWKLVAWRQKFESALGKGTEGQGQNVGKASAAAESERPLLPRRLSSIPAILLQERRLGDIPAIVDEAFALLGVVREELRFDASILKRSAALSIEEAAAVVRFGVHGGRLVKVAEDLKLSNDEVVKILSVIAAKRNFSGDFNAKLYDAIDIAEDPRFHAAPNLTAAKWRAMLGKCTGEVIAEPNLGLNGGVIRSSGVVQSSLHRSKATLKKLQLLLDEESVDRSHLFRLEELHAAIFWQAAFASSGELPVMKQRLEGGETLIDVLNGEIADREKKAVAVLIAEACSGDLAQRYERVELPPRINLADLEGLLLVTAERLFADADAKRHIWPAQALGIGDPAAFAHKVEEAKKRLGAGETYASRLDWLRHIG